VDAPAEPIDVPPPVIGTDELTLVLDSLPSALLSSEADHDFILESGVVAVALVQGGLWSIQDEDVEAEACRRFEFVEVE
jgi:hypothetical protein